MLQPSVIAVIPIAASITPTPIIAQNSALRPLLPAAVSVAMSSPSECSRSAYRIAAVAACNASSVYVMLLGVLCPLSPVPSAFGYSQAERGRDEEAHARREAEARLREEQAARQALEAERRDLRRREG